MFPGALPCLTLLLSFRFENKIAGSLSVLLSVNMVCQPIWQQLNVYGLQIRCVGAGSSLTIATEGHGNACVCTIQSESCQTCDSEKLLPYAGFFLPEQASAEAGGKRQDTHSGPHASNRQASIGMAGQVSSPYKATKRPWVPGMRHSAGTVKLCLTCVFRS